MKYVGDWINQPPVGFYIEALFFKVFGLSFDNGVALITFIGLGCAFLVYEIGKVLYGKPTGLLAAALFGLTPWELALSRSFLIDVQCLFFSLLFLLVGIFAIRKNSFKLFMVSGTIFAIAFLTKFYAVYALIPLGLFYIYYRPKNLKRIFAWVGAYFVPLLIFFFLWYQVISGQGLLAAFKNTDFNYHNPAGFVPSYFFVGNFLLNSLGGWLLAATTVSLLIGFMFRKSLSKILVFDLICLATIVIVGSVNTVLGAGLNFSPPYTNSIKYDYQALPFICLLAASLVGKCVSLFNSLKSKGRLSMLLFLSVSLVGLVLLAAAILFNMSYAHHFSTWSYLVFKVESTGYSFVDPAPIGKYSSMMGVQYLGFVFVLSGLLWTSRNKLGWICKLVHHE
jgi:4-amino-4-deoxy-L-arabinose transferase-like glycosyltransferase